MVGRYCTAGESIETQSVDASETQSGIRGITADIAGSERRAIHCTSYKLSGRKGSRRTMSYKLSYNRDGSGEWNSQGLSNVNEINTARHSAWARDLYNGPKCPRGRRRPTSAGPPMCLSRRTDGSDRRLPRTGFSPRYVGDAS